MPAINSTEKYSYNDIPKVDATPTYFLRITLITTSLLIKVINPLLLLPALAYLTFDMANHMKRAMRGYGVDAEEQKNWMFTHMTEDEQASFLNQIFDEHKGKSGIFASTRDSKKFDTSRRLFEGYQERKNPPTFKDLRKYMGIHETIHNEFIYSPHSNSGRTLFSTVMRVRDLNVLQRFFDELNEDRKSHVISAINASYKSSRFSCEASKDLAASLIAEDSDENKFTAVKSFLDSEYVLRNRNNKNFKMLEILEKEITRVYHCIPSAPPLPA